MDGEKEEEASAAVEATQNEGNLMYDQDIIQSVNMIPEYA